MIKKHSKKVTNNSNSMTKYLTHPVFSAMMLTGGTVLVVVEAVAEVVVLFCCWEVEGE